MSEAHGVAQQRRRERETATKSRVERGLELPQNGSKVPMPKVQPPKADLTIIREARAMSACIAVPTELLEPGVVLKITKLVNQLAQEVQTLRDREAAL